MEKHDPVRKEAPPDTSRRIHKTPLDQWKAMARIENAAMRAGKPVAQPDSNVQSTKGGGPSPDSLIRHRVINLYTLSRHGVPRISVETGLSVDAVRDILLQWRKERDNVHAPRPQQLAKSDPEEVRRKTELSLLCGLGLPPEDIAMRMGIPEAEVWRVLSGQNRTVHQQGKRRSHSAEFYRLRHARAQALRADGLTVGAVAKRIGVTPETLTRDERLVREMDGPTG